MQERKAYRSVVNREIGGDTVKVVLLEVPQGEVLQNSAMHVEDG